MALLHSNECASATLLLSETLLVEAVVAVLLALGDNDQVVGSVWIDLDRSELASADVVLEKNIQICVGKTLRCMLARVNSF